MKVRVLLVATIALSSLAAIPSGARAGEIVVSNLAEPFSLYDNLTVYVPPSQPGFEAAQAFTTGANDYLLETIVLKLGNFDPGSNGDFGLLAGLYVANSDGTPGTFVTSFNSGPFLDSGFSDVTFNPVDSVLLSAGTTYLLVLQGQSSDGTGSIAWAYSQTLDSSGPGTLPFFNTSFDAGATWNGPFSPPNGGTPYLIQVNGTLSVPIPEPASWLLGAIGLGTALLATRRARKGPGNEGQSPVG